MNRRRMIAGMVVLWLTAGVLWSVTGGVTVAQGQEKPIVIKRAHASAHRPSFDRPIYVLALGSDAGARRYGRGGSVQRGRADSIHVVAIEPKTKQVTIIGIPRDSYVPVTCFGRSTKINAGMFFGGPKCMVETIERYIGVSGFTFDYYMVAGFDQVENMVNGLGGVIVKVERGLDGTLTDRASRARGIRPGRQTLNGQKALAYARDRHDYGRGDFDRSVHQGEVMVGALEKARADAAKRPGRTIEYLRIIFKNITTDVGVVEAFRIGLLLLQIDPKTVTNRVLPGGTGTTDAGSSVLLSSQARTLLRDLVTDGVL